MIEDYLAKTGAGRCHDFKEVADRLSAAFRLYMGGAGPSVVNWSPAADEFSLLWTADTATGAGNPLTEWVELPDHLFALCYSSIYAGAIRGALEMIAIEVQCRFVQDALRGDAATEIRVKFIRKLEDALPPGED